MNRVEQVFHLPPRKFRALFGVCENTALVLLRYLGWENDMMSWTHLFWTLYFLRTYPTLDVASAFWKVDPKTFEVHVWKTIYLLKNLELV